MLGLAAAVVIALSAPPEGLTREAWIVVAIAVLMATWWATEAIPIPATALLPIVLLPMSGVTTIDAATAPYATPVVFLFLGGFIIATAIERWGLHRRIALGIIVKIGKDSHLLILAFMLATAILSMWISNTATTLMMTPIAISVARTFDDDQKADVFAIALLLGIAYSSSIGGLMTPVGSPPNLVALGYLKQAHDIDVSFGRWMAVAAPIGVLMLASTWYLLTRRVFRVNRSIAAEGAVLIRTEFESIGAVTTPERRIVLVFALVASAWMFRPLLANVPGLSNISDPTIAIAGAISMFLIPAGKDAKGVALLDWDSAQKLPWGVILLFGGGLSLAGAIAETGLAAWIGENLSVMTAFYYGVFLLSAVALVVFMTELTSNTATMATLAPVLGAITIAAGYDPLLIIIPAALAVNCAFMLPVATPPNAIVFASGRVRIPDMIRAGIWLNLIAILAISGVTYFTGPLLL